MITQFDESAEIHVNTTTAGAQAEPQVVVLESGNYVVAWKDPFGAPGNTRHIRGQLYAPDGTPIGSEFQLNSTITTAVNKFALEALPGGGFIGVWTVEGNSQTAYDYQLRAQIFNADTSKAGTEFTVNTLAPSSQDEPAVTVLANGNLVITWNTQSGVDVKGQIVSPNGTLIGSEFPVNSFLAGDQSGSAVAALTGGGFVAIWTDDSDLHGSGSGEDIVGQLFSDTGARIGGSFLVNTTTGFRQYLPTVAALPNGGFVVAWIDRSGSSSSPMVKAQLHDEAGAKVGGEIIVDQGANFRPMVETVGVTTLAGGGFLITWDPNFVIGAFSGSGPVEGQLFDDSGAKVGGIVELRDAAGHPAASVVTALPDGGFVLAYAADLEGPPSNSLFGDERGIGAIRFEAVRDGESMVGTGAAEAIGGGGLADYLDGQGADDILSGGGGDDILHGRLGNDVLDGGAGADRLHGGFGDDRYVNVDLADVIVERGGVDEVETALAAYSLAAGVENLTGTSPAGQALTGNALANRILGGVGADVIDGGAGADDMRGGLGADVYRVDSSSDIVVEASGEGVDEIRTSLATYSLAALPFVENLTGLSIFGHTLTGNGNGNVLTGGGGEDVLNGDAGNDRLIGGHGVDSYAGGDGVDTVDFSGEPGPVGVNLHASLSYFPWGHPYAWQSLAPGQALDSYGNTETLTGIENLILTAGDDRMLGSDGAERVEGGAGNDEITPKGGDDVVLGGAGNDEISGGDGNDDIQGGDGEDLIFGDSGSDTMDGGAGDDFVLDQSGDDSLSGGDGNDFLRGGVGDDSFDGGDNHGFNPNGYGDRVSFYDQSATQAVVADLRTGIVSNDGFGNVETIVGIETLGWGTAFADTFHGNDSINFLNGSRGDSLHGHGEDDHLELTAAAALVDGGAGVDQLKVQGVANDLLPDSNGDGLAEFAPQMATGWNVDLAAGTLRDGYDNVGTVVGIENLGGSLLGDRLRGSAVANWIDASDGNDFLLLQDGGDDTALGGEGNDVIYFGAALTGADVADGGAGRDAIVLQGNVTAVLTDTNLAGIESISIQSGANSFFGDTANNFYDYDLTTANGNVAAGQQMIVNAQSLRAGEDFAFDGSAESDGSFLIYGGHGTDLLTGGAGADVFFFEGQRWSVDDKVDGGAGRDSMVISAGSGLNHIEFVADSIAGIESISLNNLFASDPTQKPSYELVLHNGNVAPGGTLIVNGNSIPLGQVVNIDGRSVQGGNLILFAGGGHDVLTGGAGADLIFGGGGADALTGGAGADTFRYDSATDSNAGLPDLIGDFQTGVDRIDLSRIDANSHADGNQAFAWIGSNAFSGTGAASAGELRLYEQGGYQRIEGDTNGDGIADLLILLQVGTAPLVQGDFVV